MNGKIIELMSIDYPSFLAAMVTIIAGFLAIKEILERFCKAVGIEFSWIKSRRETQECQQTIKHDLEELAKRQRELKEERKRDMDERARFDNEIKKCIEGIKQEIADLGEHIEKREAEKRFKKLRFDILNFADRISKSESISSELVEQVFDEIQDYENLVSEYEFKNNRVNASIVVIQQKYQELLMQGKVFKED